MSEKSSVLFLIICSQTKNDNFEQYEKNYTSGNAFFSKLSPVAKSLLLQKRNEALELITGSNLKQGKTFVKDLKWNKLLKRGPDFGKNELGSYLPAIDVYQGRFYQAMGKSGMDKIQNSQHNVIIISGLYGMLFPNEPVQIYESPMEDFLEIQNVWRDDRTLTKILLDYLISQNISAIVNLSSQLAYINLFDWEWLKNEYFQKKGQDLKVLFSFHEVMKGQEALVKLGELFGKEVIGKSEADIMSIKNGGAIGSIVFRSSPDYEREVEILQLIRSYAWEEVFGNSDTEHELVEFKPQLFDKGRTDGTSRSIEFECFKTIGAFLNTNGGALFIGVRDNKSIRGINQEYLDLNKISNTPYPLPLNQDGYRQLYDSMFSKYIGKKHFGKTELKFWKKDGKDVAIVCVAEKSDTPVAVRDHNDQNHFFVRGSSSSRELFGRQKQDYISENFSKQ